MESDMHNQQTHLAIVGGTIIDGNGGKPIEGGSVLIAGKRIAAIGDASLPIPQEAQKISVAGKYIIPGLLNANVHLFGLHPLESLVRYEERYEELIEEGAQIALKNGLTTVFDTWGPRRFLMNVRDRIEAGEVMGSRFFCGGNIVGFDGPFSPDFFPKAAEVASAPLVKRINAIWVENVGRHLMWLTPDQVAKEVGAYIARGVNFIKYGSNDHWPGSFLVFSQEAQSAIVEEAHRAGITAQAHSMAVEGLRTAVAAGCDLVTHCNITGPTPIPETTLELMAKRKTGAVIFPQTARGFEWIMENVSDVERSMWPVAETNASNLIKSGAPLLLANDGAIWSPDWSAGSQWGKTWNDVPIEDRLSDLATGHFTWLRAMEEKGCPPMSLLQAATRNIAQAYRVDKDVGTLEAGKFADLLILNQDPLRAAKNYQSIHSVIKEGVVIDRGALPLKPIMTAARGPAAEEEARYVPFVSAQRFPMCPMCAPR